MKEVCGLPSWLKSLGPCSPQDSLVPESFGHIWSVRGRGKVRGYKSWKEWGLRRVIVRRCAVIGMMCVIIEKIRSTVQTS